MKKIGQILLIIGFLIALITNDHVLRLFQRNQGDDKYFERLSEQYYGTPEFGRSLAIVNQTIQFKKGMTHTDMIVPSRDAIIRLYENYRVASAVRMIDEVRIREVDASVERSADPKLIQKGAFFFPVSSVVLLVALIAGYAIGRKK